jgi:hypothetical protein
MAPSSPPCEISEDNFTGSQAGDKLICSYKSGSGQFQWLNNVDLR